MAADSPVRALTDHFATLEDPRVERTKLHPLSSIITIALCAVICGAESWDERIEVRCYRVIPDADVLAWLQDGHHWPGLQAIGMVEAERRIGEKRTGESRYYLLSAPLKAGWDNNFLLQVLRGI